MPQEKNPRLFTAVIFTPVSEQKDGYLLIDSDLESLRSTVEKEVQGLFGDFSDEYDFSWTDDSASAAYGVTDPDLPWAKLYSVSAGSATYFSEFH